MKSSKKAIPLKQMLMRPLLLFLIIIWVTLCFFIFYPLQQVMDSKSQMGIVYSLSYRMAVLSERFDEMVGCLNSVSSISMDHAWSYLNNKSYWLRAESKRKIQTVLDTQLLWRNNECLLLDLDEQKFLIGTTYLTAEDTQKLFAQMEEVSNNNGYILHQPILLESDMECHLMMSMRFSVGAPTNKKRLIALVISKTPLTEMLEKPISIVSDSALLAGHIYIVDANGNLLNNQQRMDDKVVRFTSDTNAYDVRLIHEIPEAEYYRGLRELVVQLTMLIVLGGVAVISLAYMIARKIRQPINGVISVIQNIQLGIPLNSCYLRATGIEEYDQILDYIQEADRRIRNEKEMLIQAEKDKHAKDVMLLRMQINPHFLYNALNAVQWMARLNNTQEIEAYMNALLYILHYNLDEDEQHLVTLATELKLAHMYVKVHQYRYENEITLQIHGNPDLPILIPRFILQPLVENAIYHGLKNEPGCIDLKIVCEDGKVHLSVCDSGHGISPDVLRAIYNGGKHGMGIGIRYVNSIVMDYGGALTISNIKKGETICGTEAKITLDIITADAAGFAFSSDSCSS